MTTTIKVSAEVRDRLKIQAASARRTLGEHLRHLADLEDRALRFDALSTAIRSTDAKTMNQYRDEVSAWERLDRE